MIPVFLIFIRVWEETCLEGEGEDVEETSTVEATAGGGCGCGGAVRLLIPPPAAVTGTPLVEMTGTPSKDKIIKNFS